MAYAIGLPDLTADGSTPIGWSAVLPASERICRPKFTDEDRLANAIAPPLHELVVDKGYGKSGSKNGKDEEADTTVGEDELEDMHLSSENGVPVDTEVTTWDMPAELSLS